MTEIDFRDQRSSSFFFMASKSRLAFGATRLVGGGPYEGSRMMADQMESIPWVMTGEELDCLCRMARSAESIVELGTNTARSLAAMMMTNPGAHAGSVDLFQDPGTLASAERVEAESRGKLARVSLESETSISASLGREGGELPGTIDLLHIDARHALHMCKRDVDEWLSRVVPGGAVCVHAQSERHNTQLPTEQVVDQWCEPEHWAEVERCGTMVAFRNTSAEEGALYVAYGDKARDGVQQSIGSLRRVAPKLPVAVVSDRPIDGADYPIVHVEVDRGARAQKTRMYSLSPFRKTLFLDADTRVLQSPSAGFRLLDWGDLVLAQDRNPRFSQAHWHTLDPTEREVTSAELRTEEVMYWNSGVVFFRRNNRVRRMMQAWHREWTRWQKQDQMALLRAINQEPVRVVGMRPPWNSHRQDVAEFVLHLHHQVAREGAPA